MNLAIGDNIAHAKSPFNGSLGGFVICRDSKKIGLLSSGHVLAHPKAKEGDDIQRNTTHTHRGAIKKTIAKLGFSQRTENCDAAIAWLTEEISPITQIPHCKLSFSGVREPIVGDVLAKVGCATGLTRARVTAIGRYPTRYGSDIVSMQAMYLEPLYDQPGKKVVSHIGDCGSVWFDETTGEAVGLHFAGESYSAYGPIHGKACFMTVVLEALDVELYVGNSD